MFFLFFLLSFFCLCSRNSDFKLHNSLNYLCLCPGEDLFWDPHPQAEDVLIFMRVRQGKLLTFTSTIPCISHYSLGPSVSFLFPWLIPFSLYSLKCCEIQNSLLDLHLSFNLHCPMGHPFSLVQDDRWIPNSLTSINQYSGFSHIFFFFFLRPYSRHMEVPRLGVESELELPACATPTVMRDLSHVCHLHHSSRQCWILNPLSEVKDQTRVFTDPSQVH